MPLALAEKKQSHYVVFDIKKKHLRFFVVNSNTNLPIKTQKDNRPTYSLKLAEFNFVFFHHLNVVNFQFSI